MIMNLEEKKNLVIQLHEEGKTQREIAQELICLLEILAESLEN